MQQLASAHQGELLRLLRSGDPEALPGAIDLAGRLKLEGAVAGLGDVMSSPDAGLRLAATGALIQIGTPGRPGPARTRHRRRRPCRAGGCPEGAQRPRVQGRAPPGGGSGAGQGPEGPRFQRAARLLRGLRRHRRPGRARGPERSPRAPGNLPAEAERATCGCAPRSASGSSGRRRPVPVLESVAEDNDRQVRNAVAAALRGVTE